MKRKILFGLLIAIVLSEIAMNVQMNANTGVGILEGSFVMHSSTSLSQNEKIQSQEIVPGPPSGLIVHGVITILNNSALANQATTGSGKVNDPYIISGYSITASGTKLIDIENTDKPTIIENNYLTGSTVATPGIYAVNVTNLVIKNNYFMTLTYGVFVDNTINQAGVVIQNNTILGTAIDGIYVSSVVDGQILENYILAGSIGVQTFTTVDLTLKDNFISNVDYAINLVGDIRAVVINNNISIVTNGLYIQSIHSSVLSSNWITGYDYTMGYGIYLETIQNTNVTSNYVTFFSYGLYSRMSQKSIYSTNVLFNISLDSITLSSDDHNTIQGNIITVAGNHGIWIDSSNHINVLDNTIDNCNYLMQLSSSGWIIISKNSFLNSYISGVIIISSDNNTITNSVFDGTGDYNLIVSSGFNNHIIENIFRNATNYNLLIEKANNTIVMRNQFLNPPIFGISQAFDNGFESYFAFNYWVGWTNPDQNNDGIVDYPFLIAGKSLSYDNMPLASLSAITPDGIVSPYSSEPVTVSTNTSVSTTSTTKHKASPGYTADILLLGLPVLGILALFNRKKSKK